MTENNYEEILSNFKSSSFEYVKILVFNFILPFWLCTAINQGSVLWKIFSWFSQNIEFWKMPQYMSATTAIMMVFPASYLIWFYYLTVKKLLLQLYYDLFQYWNIEIGNDMAESIIKINNDGLDFKSKFDFNSVLIYLNKKISKLPKALQWVARKLLDKIPFLEFVNSFTTKDLEESNKENLSKSITKKINEFSLELINSIVPFWTKFIIPINLLSLIYYLGLS